MERSLGVQPSTVYLCRWGHKEVLGGDTLGGEVGTSCAELNPVAELLVDPRATAVTLPAPAWSTPPPPTQAGAGGPACTYPEHTDRAGKDLV